MAVYRGSGGDTWRESLESPGARMYRYINRDRTGLATRPFEGIFTHAAFAGLISARYPPSPLNQRALRESAPITSRRLDFRRKSIPKLTQEKQMDDSQGAPETADAALGSELELRESSSDAILESLSEISSPTTHGQGSRPTNPTPSYNAPTPT